MRTKSINLSLFLLCVFLLAGAVFLQYELRLAPCPLCIIQRILFIVLGILFLLGTILPLKNKGRRFLYGIIFLFSSLGAAVAGRQIWLENLPAGIIVSCEASLNSLIQSLPFAELIKTLFQGTGQCTRSNWEFLDLTIPEWTFVFFIFFIIISIWQIFSKKIGIYDKK